jgi:hypothetical protein
MTTLFIAFEDMGYDGHFIDADDSKIFTKREFAEAYAEEKIKARKQEVRDWMNGQTEEERLEKFTLDGVNNMDDYLEKYPGNYTWMVEELELVN